MGQILFLSCYFLVVVAFAISATGQKISATAGSENQTVSVYFYTNDKTSTSHSLNCLPDWEKPPQPVMSWDVTNVPTAVEGMDYVKSNNSVSDGILWLSFIRLTNNVTGTYVCVAVGPDGTSYTNFDVHVSDGSLSAAAIVGIVIASILLAIAAVYGAMVAAKRLNYVSV